MDYLQDLRGSDGVYCQMCGEITAHCGIAVRKVYACTRCSSLISPCADTVFTSPALPFAPGSRQCSSWFEPVEFRSANFLWCSWPPAGYTFREKRADPDDPQPDQYSDCQPLDSHVSTVPCPPAFARKSLHSRLTSIQRRRCSNWSIARIPARNWDLRKATWILHSGQVNRLLLSIQDRAYGVSCRHSRLGQGVGNTW